MSADRQALLQALREEPDDLHLRLIFADWLEDNGDSARAEFVRLCAELATLSSVDPRRTLLERRRKQLVRANRKRWWPDLNKDARNAVESAGLVQRLDLNATTFLNCGSAFVGEPLARLRLTDVAPCIESVFDSPSLVGVRELTLAQSLIGDDEMNTLASSPALAGLHTLRLLCCNLDEGRTARLAQSPHLANLKVLDLEQYERRDHEVNNTVWRNAGVTRVMSGGGTGRYNQIGDDGLTAIARSPHLAGLESLFVAHAWIDVVGVRQLLVRGRLKHLRKLDLSYNYLGPEGLRELAQSTLMKRLTSLEVQGNEVGPVGVGHLAASPNIRQLQLLDISGSPYYDDRPRLNDEAAESLAGSPHLAGLEHLILSYTELGTAGAEALAKSKGLRSLRSLYLGHSRIGDRGAKALAESDLLGQLTHLDLGANGLRKSGAMALIRSKSISEELTLDLAGNRFTEKTVEALRERFGAQVRLGDEGGV